MNAIHYASLGHSLTFDLVNAKNGQRRSNDLVRGDEQVEGCPTCENWDKENPIIIMENDKARAICVDEYREGHSIVYVKRHVQSISAIEPDEYASVFELITKVSKALEKKYSARKTYLIVVGDSDKFQHLHFHLLPKHRNLPSMGVYCFQKLWEAEPPRKTPDDERAELARQIKGIIEEETVA